MRKLLNHSAMPAIGFMEPWSSKAGSETKAFISSVDPDAAIAIVSLDRDVEEQVVWPIERSAQELSHQSYDLGSWLEIPATRPDCSTLKLELEILFTSNAQPKPVISIGSSRLLLDPEGLLTWNGAPVVHVKNERWYRLRLSMASSQASFEIETKEGALIGQCLSSHEDVLEAVHIAGDGELSMPTLNARIGRVSLARDGDLSEWQFPTRGLPKVLDSLESGGGKLLIHGMPTFAVASARFDGDTHDPRLAPDHFDAIHLHDDDFGGFDWPSDLTIQIPADARSGVYALMINTAHGIEKLPFFVRPREARSKIAVLLPTATYLAYADEQLPPDRYPWHGSDHGHRFAIDNNFLSLYDVHSDTSGVSLTSSRRPRATLRDDYHYPLSNCPHLLPVDLQLLKFLGRENIDVDILTDHDLHAEGLESLRSYDLLMTGSHPEYWSSHMMRGLEQYAGAGGSIAYLGGNGFYWVVAFQDDKMELRRGKNDIWAGRPGEIHMAMTGEPGGNWEDRGRHHPQSLLGVTYVIMGFGPSRPYRRLEGSRSGEFAWLFEGVVEGSFGDEGTVLGGAAGYEIDATLPFRDTPENLVRLAVADGFDDSFQVRPDLWVAGSEADRAALRRADMTAYRHEAGGLVLSVSSVAWLGALPKVGSDNAVGQIMRNLVGKFA